MSITWRGREVTAAVRAAQRRALEAGALIVEGDAIMRCPVGQYPPSSGRVGGRLRGSITHEVGSEEAQIGTNVEYAPYVEYGTSRMRAQPFLRPALDQNQTEIRRVMANIISQALR